MERRATVGQRKAFLRNILIEQCLDGTLPQGAPAPPLRALAEAYHLSIPVVRQVLQGLCEEGYFHIVPRIGTFVGRPANAQSELYLMLLPDTQLETDPDSGHLPGPYSEAKGFEERIAQLGGACVALPLDVALERREQGRMPPFAGVFVMHNLPWNGRQWSQEDAIPCVLYETPEHYIPHADHILFDHVEAGKQAVRHLLNLGHRRIYFLAAHASPRVTSANFWSAEREQGWREALCEAGLPHDGLAGHPQGPEAQREGARETVALLRQRPDITAVVAANSVTAMQLLAALRADDLPLERWPAIICFDNQPEAQKYMLSSLRLPLEQAGRVAAELLWERRHGRLAGPPVERRLPMQLIPRLTTRPHWTQIENIGELIALDN